ncbi:MAG: hypothetical protein ACLUTA_13420 [Blautia wexlerae]
MKWETTITLPNVPDPEAPNQWKLEQNEKLNDSICLEGRLEIDSGERRKLG